MNKQRFLTRPSAALWCDIHAHGNCSVLVQVSPECVRIFEYDIHDREYLRDRGIY